MNKVSRKEILNKLIYFFNHWEKALLNKGDSFIINSWVKRSWPINKKISFKEKINKSITGIYKGIDKDGSIKVAMNGTIKNFYNIEMIQ